MFITFPTGLPPDISTEEFAELMSKCGIVMRDPMTEDYKVKLYKDKDGNLKGDGLCCYLKVCFWPSCTCHTAVLAEATRNKSKTRNAVPMPFMWCVDPQVKYTYKQCGTSVCWSLLNTVQVIFGLT